MRVELALAVALFFVIVIFFQCIDSKLARLNYNTVPEQINVHKEYNQMVSSKTCRLKPDVGPCRANIPMWYFDPRKGVCSKFLWGGCQGNGNRFDNKNQCIDKCLKNMTGIGRPRWCNLNFDYGFCFGALKRYYYDHLWKVCKETIYSGCGGNKNNFYSLEQCNARCRYGNTNLIKSKDDSNKDGIKKILIVNPASATTK